MFETFIVFAAWLALNVVVSRRVMAAGRQVYLPVRMLLSTIWLLPFIGALIAVLLPEWLRFAQGYYLIAYAVFVMLLLAYSPTGILGILDKFLASRRAQRASRERAQLQPRFKTSAQP